MNFSFENVLIMIILFGFLYIIFWMMIKTKNTVLKFVVIFSVFLFFILFCVRRNEKSYYELNSIGTSYETNENNKIKKISLYYGGDLGVSLEKKLRNLYLLKSVKILYQNKEIGIIEINKNINELDCYNDEMGCIYSIGESLENILNKENFQSKLDYSGNNIFKFKVYIESKEKGQKSEFILNDVPIWYKKAGLEFNWIPM